MSGERPLKRAVDPKSIAGKSPRVAGHVPLLVAGAGPAGVTEATEAARAAVEVMLVRPCSWLLGAMVTPGGQDSSGRPRTRCTGRARPG